MKIVVCHRFFLQVYFCCGISLAVSNLFNLQDIPWGHSFEYYHLNLQCLIVYIISLLDG